MKPIKTTPTFTYDGEPIVVVAFSDLTIKFIVHGQEFVEIWEEWNRLLEVGTIEIVSPTSSPEDV
jgi:hypothetical protein